MKFGNKTIYKGIIFRSKLEAKWAYYFDLIGLKYEYEPRPFQLSNGDIYLPDFNIPGFGYIEIKPDREIEGGELKKAILLSKNYAKNVAIFKGLPALKGQLCFYGGEECAEVCFSKYSVNKWGQTPYFGPYFLEEWEEKDILRNKRDPFYQDIYFKNKAKFENFIEKKGRNND